MGGWNGGTAAATKQRCRRPGGGELVAGQGASCTWERKGSDVVAQKIEVDKKGVLATAECEVEDTLIPEASSTLRRSLEDPRDILQTSIF